MARPEATQGSSETGDALLLTPGPLTTSRRVKEAMQHDWGSRDATFLRINREVMERLPEIVAFKNAVARDELDARYPSRLQLPDGMTSGLYKYIVFDWLERSTGRVYDEPCHRIMGHDVELPNSDWVARNHSCVPLYYRPSA